MRHRHKTVLMNMHLQVSSKEYQFIWIRESPDTARSIIGLIIAWLELFASAAFKYTYKLHIIVSLRRNKPRNVSYSATNQIIPTVL